MNSDLMPADQVWGYLFCGEITSRDINAVPEMAIEREVSTSMYQHRGWEYTTNR